MRLERTLAIIQQRMGNIHSTFRSAKRMEKPHDWIMCMLNKELDLLPKTFPSWARERIMGAREALFKWYYEYLVHCYVIHGQIVLGEWNKMSERQREYLRKERNPISGFCYRETLTPYSPDIVAWAEKRDG